MCLPSDKQSQGCLLGTGTRASLPPVAVGRDTGGPAQKLAKKQTPSGMCVLQLKGLSYPQLQQEG